MSNRTHGHTAGARSEHRRPSKTYSVWNEMRARCRNPKHARYADYGGRGITVCERWEDFRNFLADMGEAPPGLTLDRRDNDKGYSKANCRWAPAAIQNRNTRKNRMITYDGETLCASVWARRVGVGVSTLCYRLRAGWSVEEALFIRPISTQENQP